ncbi:MAG: helix-turn-helix domain-containing protein [Anaerohalosphaera sp.]|nr:helix-turn-helix domain-containing protein [Anaerohalosphaera sp.]
MRPPAKIKPHLTIDKMFQWLQNAPDEDAHKRRMAVWLTHTGKLHAKQIAEILEVSMQSVWLWVGQYNDKGPEGLTRTGRGGRRWGFLTPEQEEELLRPYTKKLHQGILTKPLEIKIEIERKIGKPVSMQYVYRLLQRHKWPDLIAQSGLNERQEDQQSQYQKMLRPWQR